MKVKSFLALTAAIALLVGGVAVFKGQAQDRLAGHRGGPVLQQIVEKLGLKEEQITKIKAELRAEKDTLVPLLKELHSSRQALREAIHASDATEASVRDAAKKVAATESDLAVERMKLSAKIGPILTDEQLDKVKAFEAKSDDAVLGILKKIGEALEKE
jgi:Spy/CpxP family protein refolding chaperone